MHAIDEYMTGLDRRLVGPRRVKAELLAEARDSLTDAAEAYAARGVDVAAAARRAVGEFGGYREVAPGYQAELAAAQGRRTALLVALALPLLHALAPLMWLNSPWNYDVRDGSYLSLAAAFDYLALGGGAAAAVVWLGYGRGSRFVPDSRRLTRWLGTGVLAFLAVHGLAGAAVYLWSIALWPSALTWPPIVIGGIAMTLAFGYAAVSAWGCVRTARPAST